MCLARSLPPIRSAIRPRRRASFLSVGEPAKGQVIAIKNQRPQLRPRVEAILEVISEVCLEHLDEEYAVLSARLIGRLARKRPSPLRRGQPRIWAAGAIYTVAVNNFLFDAAQTPHMRAADLSELVGVPQATMYNKSNQIRELLGLRSPLDPELCRQDLIEDHPTAWLVQVDSLIVDARTLPHDLQQEARLLGLIPNAIPQ